MSTLTGLSGVIEPYTNRTIEWIHGQGGAVYPSLYKVTTAYFCSRAIVVLAAAGVFYSVPLLIVAAPWLVAASKVILISVFCIAVYAAVDVHILYDEQEKALNSANKQDKSIAQVDAEAAQLFLQSRQDNRNSSELIFKIILPPCNPVWNRLFG